MSSRGSVTKRKRKKGYVYESRWYEEGTQRSRNFDTAADAKAFLNNTLDRLNRGDNTTWLGDRTTLNEFYQEWLRRPIRPSTRSRDKGVMERWWLPQLGDLLMTKIKRFHIQGVIDNMSLKLAPNTVKTNYGVIRSCMLAAVNEDMIVRSPCRGINLPGFDTTKEGIRFLEPEELDRLAAVIELDYRALIYVAGVIGLRWSECTGLVVANVDLLRRKLTVDRTLTEVRGIMHAGPPNTKSGKRVVSLPEFVVNEIAAHFKRKGLTASNGTNLVFTSPRGGPMLRANFGRRTWNPAVKQAGLTGLTFHGLRHTAAGLMIAGGYTPAIIQRRLGHASIRTTYDVYGHLLPSADATVAAGLEAIWQGKGDADPNDVPARGGGSGPGGRRSDLALPI